MNYTEELKALKEGGLWRRIRSADSCRGVVSTLEETSLVNLSTNDYLGLAGDQALQEEFLLTLRDRGAPLFGSTGSRLLSGAHRAHEDLESHLEGLFPGKSCLIFNSGYHGNLGIIPALVGPGDVVFSDRLNHASLTDGLRLSGARWFRYRHRDLDHLEALLKKERPRFQRALLVTESLFSMDGDRADLAALGTLKNQYDTLLMVDEAHAFGLFGPSGTGLAAEAGVLSQVDVLLGTFGKALASQGAFAATTPEIRDLLIQKARTLLFSTALPPVNCLWILFLLGKEALLQDRRVQLSGLCQKYGGEEKNSPIRPVLVGGAARAVEFSRRLEDRGFLVPAIRPPTVPEGTSRLRISLRADLTFPMGDRLETALQEVAHDLSMA